MKALAVNASNDLYRDTEGNIALALDQDAVMQGLDQAARTQLAEMIYATDRGIPYFQVVWVGSPNLTQFAAYLRREFMLVPNVLEVVQLETFRAGNELSYRAVIRTAFGLVTLNG